MDININVSHINYVDIMGALGASSFINCPHVAHTVDRPICRNNTRLYFNPAGKQIQILSRIIFPGRNLLHLVSYFCSCVGVYGECHRNTFSSYIFFRLRECYNTGDDRGRIRNHIQRPQPYMLAVKM